jgi:toxin YoeB
VSGADRDSVFDVEFREDLGHWIETERGVVLRLLDMVDSVMRDPFHGIGKPEPLKHLGAGVWARRLTREHRVIYLVEHTLITFLKARYHY